MAMSLRDALLETYDGWRDEFPAPWHSVIGDLDLDGSQVPEELELDPWVPIFPTLSTDRRVLGAPRRAHVFRAFEDIRPRDVKAVIVGQDPYPDVAKATGLSFEQGNISGWVSDSRLVSKSLRSIIQAAAATDLNDTRFLGPRGWSLFIRGLADRDLESRDPQVFFEGTRAQGVLWLNTTLSISLFRGDAKYDHQSGHRAFWSPLVGRVMDFIAQREQPSVFVLWSDWARYFRPSLERTAENAGTLGTVSFTEAAHPVKPGFLSARPLKSINYELERLRLEPIDWI